MRAPTLELARTSTSVAITYDGSPMVVATGAGIPHGGRWWWTFDGSLRLVDSPEEQGRDSLGEYSAMSLVFADEAGPLVRQSLKAYSQDSQDAFVVVETVALRELRGAALEDSFFHTTFNSPVVRLADGLACLAYTWGLEGDEGVAIGGHFPDAAVAPGLESLPEQLRRADFSPNLDVHRSADKPFAPLIAYDSQERTLVMAPLDHFLMSPMRVVQTPEGPGVARGLHGAVDYIPAGTVTRTALVFGRGLAATVVRWGDLLLRIGGKRRGQGRDSLLVRTLGFWNCYGSYYAELFRQTNADTIRELSAYYREAKLPVRYVGLDLWYHFDRVGFARDYQPDRGKYPQGLKAVMEETGLPFLLHTSASAPDNVYLDSYEFIVDEGASYPVNPGFYQDLARQFKEWGAIGIWPDFLRTQLQNCCSLRDQVGNADRWFDGLARSMAQEGLEVMLCMPTIGHYLASTMYDNIIAVRTSTDYVNHQPGQVEMLRHHEEYHALNSASHNLRQNLLLSFLAGALGLAPSYDVFITNQRHPEGFAEPDAPRQALARALSAGIVGIGDKAGWVDAEIVRRLAFPDGVLSQPDHPPHPAAATLDSDTPVFYTTTTIGDYRWTYVALFNLTTEKREYHLDLGAVVAGSGAVVYDYLAGEVAADPSSPPLARGDAGGSLNVAGELEAEGHRYWVAAPRVGGLYLLGFLDKYVTVSGRQVKAVAAGAEGVTIDMELPAGESYTLAVIPADGGAGRPLAASGPGLRVQSIQAQGGLSCIHFQVEAPHCRLTLVT